MSQPLDPTSTPSPVEQIEANRAPWTWLLIPLVAALLAFASTWGAGFVYDDIELLQTNPAMKEWATIGRAFAEPFWSLAPFQENFAGYYRPLPGASFVILHQLGGGTAWPYHFASSMVHALSALLVMKVALALGASRMTGLGTGLFFALSGAHVEAVAWASALPDLLATCFSLLAIDQFLRGRLHFALPALLLAMLSKESAYATWLLLFGVSLFGSKRLMLASRCTSLSGLALLGGIVYALRMQAFESSGAGFDMELTLAGLSLSHQILLSFGLIVRYLGFLVYPMDSRPFRPMRLDHGPEDASLWGPAAIGMIITIGALATWLIHGRRHPRVQIGLGLLFAGLAPVLNTKSIGRFPFEERFAYLSSAGFALILAFAFEAMLLRGRKTRNRNALMPIAALLATAWAITNLTPLARVTPQWANNEEFARWSTKVSPETMTPWLLAGLATLDRARNLPQGSNERIAVAEEAFDFFERSLEVNVDEVLVAAHERESGNVGLGNALYVMGDYGTAQSVYEEILKGYPYAQEAHFGLSNCLLYRADVTYATQAPSSESQQRQDAAEALLELANRALTHADQAVRGFRTLPAYYHNRSVARYWIARMQDHTQFPATEDDARRAFEMEPGNQQYFNHLLEVLALQNKVQDLGATNSYYLELFPTAPDRAELEAQLAAWGWKD
ncbi:MAG: hypothetical protein MK209_05595 [Planctomycetes bacterium]|nr:hypothetical protein [Planctomycetota bacterium]